MKPYLLALALFLSQLVDCQVVSSFPETARSLALGSATIALTDVQTTASNPAALAFLKKTTAFSLAVATPFSQIEWKKTVAAAVFEAGGTGHFSLTFAQNGFSEFRENAFRLAYGRKMTSKIGFGAAADFLSLSALDYGKTRGFTFGLGLLAQPLKKISIAIFVHNPLIFKLISGERLPTVARLGAVFQLHDELRLLAEIEKNLLSPAVAKAGLDYRLLEKIWLRAGFRSQPNRFSVGSGFVLRRGFDLDFSTEWHPILGFSPAISIGWQRLKTTTPTKKIN